MKKLLLSIALTLLCTIGVFAQAPPCSSAQAKQFDFWVGTWDLEWTDAKGVKQTGSNTITKTLSGCVIEENFDGGGTPQYLGKSYSVYEQNWGKWKQTWVDNTGAYLDFSGEMKDGKMILSREFITRQGKKVMQRMIFYNIQKNSIEWVWERSDDDGKTWNVNWKLNYKRRVS